MTGIQTNNTECDRRSLDLMLDQGLSNRLTIVLGQNPAECTQALNDWLDRRHYEVVQVDCSARDESLACSQLLLDAFTSAGIIEGLPAEDMSEELFESVLVTLMNELAARQQDLVVSLLNFYPCETSDRILSYMLEHLPQQVHIYLCCDDTPDLSCIPRLRVRRQLQTVDTSSD